MTVRYQDYYEILGVPRDADAATIKKAYRKLARQYHPDVNKSPEAEAKFKLINEAYEVLGDPEKRKRYDMLGSQWRNGQEFAPPPGWENIHFEFRTPRGARKRVIEDLGGFSDFFEMLFGSGGFPSMEAGTDDGAWERSARGPDHEADITVSLEDASHGAKKTFTLRVTEPDAHGRLRETAKKYEVRLPPGTTEGTRIRLSGQGGRGYGGAAAGDLYLHVHIEPHPVFRVSGHDLEVDLPIAPWEAALGATVAVPTLEGTLSVRIPPGTQSGQKVRLKGQGLPTGTGHNRGDLYAIVKIVVPKSCTQRERELFEELARISPFKPRGKP